jgi:hypothetical protein
LFEGVEINLKKAKEKLGGVFLGLGFWWQWKRKALLFLRVWFGAFVFSKELFVR